MARAVKLIESSSDDEIEKLSDRLESYLIDISNYMKRVVSNIFSSSIIALSFSMLAPSSFPCVGYTSMCDPEGLGFSHFDHKYWPFVHK